MIKESFVLRLTIQNIAPATQTQAMLIIQSAVGGQRYFLKISHSSSVSIPKDQLQTLTQTIMPGQTPDGNVVLLAETFGTTVYTTKMIISNTPAQSYQQLLIATPDEAAGQTIDFVLNTASNISMGSPTKTLTFAQAHQIGLIQSSNKDEDIIYNGCLVNKKESELLVLATALRHNLPDVALENMLHLVDCHLPYKLHKSKYRFLKNIPNPILQRIFICQTCTNIIDFGNLSVAECTNCLKQYNKVELIKGGDFFVYIPLKDQLEEMFSSRLYKNLRKECEESDIVNGSVYKKLRNKNVIADDDISIQWNTDGVHFCRSSKKSMWPIIVGVNELPYKLRKNNLFLCGLWYGDKKPSFNLYLKPFVDELIKLYNDGFETITYDKKKIHVKVHTLFFSSDSPARSAVMNMKQFNGEYGCTYCLQKGDRLENNARVYPFCNSDPRTKQNYLQHLQETEKLKDRKIDSVKGVKGPSLISLIPNFNLIQACPPEYMHSCLLGVGKFLTEEWFNTENKNEPFYIGKKKNEFSKKLLEFKPPREITRTPQAINNDYKASEWKTFIIYTSHSCLKEYLPPKYLRHWELFIFSMAIFSKNTISDIEFEKASKALMKFVEDLQPLYEKISFMRFNVHLLTHIPQFVKMYGALWSWSAFMYENFNGILTKLFHGTQYIPEQICKMSYRLRYIKNNSHIFSEPRDNEDVRNLFIKLMKEKNPKINSNPKSDN
ncbi:uncharacterized protein LOC106648128 [Trichogramma pretiosum]|uniref:uncharacterized protein LOC106648128 n=1 Tax=Trichogramma pretiosum TaxID=7493 RepID=UPI000C7189B3|nr:uncharacterized protein LOC106648128 [Trichogramma pretiosum]